MAACPHVIARGPDSTKLDEALHSAAELCQSRGERWTQPRHRTYELLFAAASPMKAYDLIAAYAKPGQSMATPATVYRALDFLTAHDLVHRIESLNAFLACRAGHTSHAATFLICECCGRVEEVGMAIDTAATEAADAHGFKVGRAVLEMHGACAACS